MSHWYSDLSSKPGHSPQLGCPTWSCRVPQSARFETWKSFRRVYNYFYTLQEKFRAHCFHLKYRWAEGEDDETPHMKSSPGKNRMHHGHNCCMVFHHSFFRNCHDFLQSLLQWNSQIRTFFSQTFGRVFLYGAKYSLKDDSTSYNTGELGTQAQTYKDSVVVFSNTTVIVWLDLM